MTNVTRVYLLGGITLASEIALPELSPVEREACSPRPVTLRLGAVPHHLPDAVQLDAFRVATSAQFLLSIPGVARYLVTAGTEIVVEPEMEAVASDVRGYLLGPVFVVLCQQRGLLPLHASAVGSEAGVVAFVANSGEGKSTLAAHLGRRGFRVLADDTCLIDTSQPGEAMVTPTAPWLKLWRNSLETLGKEVEGMAKVFSDEDKYRLPIAAPLQPEPIRKLFFLQSAEEGSLGSYGSATVMENIPRLEAVPLLMSLVHHAYVLEATGQREETFRRCSRVLSQASAHRLIRPWGLEHLESTVDLVDAVLRKG